MLYTELDPQSLTCMTHHTLAIFAYTVFILFCYFDLLLVFHNFFMIAFMMFITQFCLNIYIFNLQSKMFTRFVTNEILNLNMSSCYYILACRHHGLGAFIDHDVEVLKYRDMLTAIQSLKPFD